MKSFRRRPRWHATQRDLAADLLQKSHDAGVLVAFFDGCCEPKNPGGTAGYGALITRYGQIEWQDSGMIPAHPTTSNNIAEYRAVNLIFDRLLATDPRAEVHVFGDSQLVICQLWGWPPGRRLWRINGVDTDAPKGRYADDAVEARAKLKQLPRVRGFWIPRELNSIADDLSKSHLRDAGVEFRIQPEDVTT